MESGEKNKIYNMIEFEFMIIKVKDYKINLIRNI